MCSADLGGGGEGGREGSEEEMEGWGGGQVTQRQVSKSEERRSDGAEERG